MQKSSSKKKEYLDKLLKENDIAVQGVLRHLLDNAVFKEELREALDVLIERYQSLESIFNGEIGKHKKDISDSLGSLLDDIALKHKEELSVKIRSGLLTLRKEFDTEKKGILDRAKSREESLKTIGEAVIALEARINEIGGRPQDNSKVNLLRAEYELFVSSFDSFKELLSADNLRNSLESLQLGDRLDADYVDIRIPTRKGKFITLSLGDVVRKLLKDTDEYGRKILMGGFGGGGSSSAGPRHEAFTVDSSTLSVSLTNGIGAQGNAVWVRYQGKMLDHGVHYTISGNKITFIFADDFYFYDGTIISVTYFS